MCRYLNICCTTNNYTFKSSTTNSGTLESVAIYGSQNTQKLHFFKGKLAYYEIHSPEQNGKLQTILEQGFQKIHLGGLFPYIVQPDDGGDDTHVVGVTEQ